MLVSVVIPAYNAEAFIEAAVRSALEQTYSPVEVIVVNDGSTDGTQALVEGIVDERIRLLSQPNSGVNSARNQGIKAARGAFIALLDADDVWDPEKLTRQVGALQQRPEWVAVGAFMHHMALDGRVLGVSGHPIGQAELREIRAAILNPFPISSLLVRREALEEAGLFDEQLDRDVPGGVGDLDLLSRIADVGDLGCIEQVLGGYRVHSGSLSAEFFLSQRQGVRYLAARKGAGVVGRTLTLEDFRAAERWSFSRWRRDLSAYSYRAAGVAAAEGATVRAVCWALPALVLWPTRTVRRLALQRGRRSQYALPSRPQGSGAHQAPH